MRGICDGVGDEVQADEQPAEEEEREQRRVVGCDVRQLRAPAVARFCSASGLNSMSVVAT
jgi:hypothetical protein